MQAKGLTEEPKVPKKGIEEFEVPAHDAITRRKQFRLKGQKKVVKDQLKAERKAEKEKKLAEGPKKRGRKPGSGKAAAKSKGDEPHEPREPQGAKKKEPSTVPTETAETTPPDVKGTHVLPSSLSSKGKGSKSLAKLRSFTQKRKAKQMEQGNTPKKGATPPKKSKGKVPAKKTDASQAVPASASSTKGNKVQKKLEWDNASKGKSERVEKPKVEAKAKRAPRKKLQVAEALPDPDHQAFVEGVLQECTESECTHPSYKQLTLPKDFELTTYWSRKCVGVKMSKSLLPPSRTSNPNRTKVKTSQIAYFSCPTSCAYTNLALAQVYVTWIHG